MQKLHEAIINNLKPRTYKKIDDIRIDLLQPRTPLFSAFDRAIQDLTTSGRLELNGNCVRLNQ